MGGKQSNFGAVYVEADQPYFVGGQIVSGKIHVDIRKPFPGNQLCLKVVGDEITRWRQRVRGRERRRNHGRRRRINQGYKSMLSFRIPIMNWQSETIPVGQYVFPFSFKLPKPLPGSFSYEQKKHICAKVTYRMVAMIDPTSPKSKVKPLHYSLPLVIREDIAPQDIRADSQEDVKHFYNLGLFEAGSTSLRCTVQKNAFPSNERIDATLAIDNTKCNSDLKELSVKVIQEIRMKSNDGVERTIVNSLEKKKFEGPKKRMQVDREISILLGGHYNQNSTYGTALTCQYYLQVKTKPDSMLCFSKGPKVKIPIRIFANELKPQVMEVQAPKDWQPKVFPENKFVLNEELSVAPDIPDTRQLEEGDSDQDIGYEYYDPSHNFKNESAGNSHNEGGNIRNPGETQGGYDYQYEECKGGMMGHNNFNSTGSNMNQSGGNPHNGNAYNPGNGGDVNAPGSASENTRVVNYPLMSKS
eukprot:CAMPEP_0114985582 /NCGR_PEP_ID=MMETSP0216-20121206/7943_1 /TAXON_ID=223996 /ORGANISM="Protocruzia adherens, Strain Boccale" /LENGTH=470 /DNA_ID=CAMNT_0002347907 /DNA_START=2253 /DNA_END=3665 /DNA_ORIENTATION=-